MLQYQYIKPRRLTSFNNTQYALLLPLYTKSLICYIFINLKEHQIKNMIKARKLHILCPYILRRCYSYSMDI